MFPSTVCRGGAVSPHGVLVRILGCQGVNNNGFTMEIILTKRGQWPPPWYLCYECGEIFPVPPNICTCIWIQIHACWHDSVTLLKLPHLAKNDNIDTILATELWKFWKLHFYLGFSNWKCKKYGLEIWWTFPHIGIIPLYVFWEKSRQRTDGRQTPVPQQQLCPNSQAALKVK